MLLLLQQRAAIIEDTGYERVLAAIAMLTENMDWAASQAWQQAKDKVQQERTEQERRRRERIDTRCRAVHAKAQQGRPPPPPPPRIRLTSRRGYRQARDVPLTTDDLYLDDARPSLIPHPLIEHICILCHNAKSHPVL